MCGIFGLASKNGSQLNFIDAKNSIDKLFILSESRGKESSGIAVKNTGTGNIEILKKPIAASTLIKTEEYASFFENTAKEIITTNKPIGIIGHSRLVTDGSEEDNNNNQPVIKSGGVAVHNGIITNADDLWLKYRNELKRTYEVDTEIFLDLIRLNIGKGKTIIDSIKTSYGEIEGSASIAVLMEDANKLLLATNTGSLYFCLNKEKTMFYFASEKYIISQLIETLRKGKKGHEIGWIKPFTGKLIDLNKLSIVDFDFTENVKNVHFQKKQGHKLAEYDLDFNDKLKRCTKCILPETFPFIEFDEHGVCNYCKNYKKRVIKGMEELEKILEKHRNKNNEPDCIVTLSGGRDSIYGLHYIKTVMKMNPLAYTYDWAMVTDLARRNQARICGKLGVEHIIVSADIRKKRNNIKKNIIAWFKKPNLGIIPLFMAGDKQVYHYVHKLLNQTGIRLIIWMDNKLENTDFKVGFAGISPLFEKKQIDNLLPMQKLKMGFYYLRNFVSNPAYLNSSMFDTLWAYYSQYIKPRKNICSLYEFIEWDEEKITSTLINEYNWETAVDTVSTWRIGDETAPFYNYVYYTVAGFTENDTFRSNQIREKLITRQKALELIRQENRPRPESINLYFKKIKLDMDFNDLQKKLKPYQLKIK